MEISLLQDNGRIGIFDGIVKGTCNMLFLSKITPKSFIRLLQDVEVKKAVRRVVFDGLEGVVIPSDVMAQGHASCNRAESKSVVPADVSRATDVFHEYLTLPEHYRARMKMINASSLLAFIVSGCLGQNLSLVWDACKNAIGDRPDAARCVEVMAKVFDFYFDTINAASQGLVYERLSISSGEMLNEDLVVCASCAPQIAKIKEVLLQGYKFSGKSGRVVRRSLVEVETEVI